MSRKIPRLLFVATMVAGVSAPMFAYASGPAHSSVDAWNPPRGFEVVGARQPHVLEINPNDSVSWNIMDADGTHTVTPKDDKQWGGPGGGDTNTPLKQSDPRYTKTFKNPGDYVYYCKIHGGIDPSGNPTGMWGIIRVIDPNAQPPATQPPATQPPATQPPATQPTTTPTQPATTPVTTATAPATGRPAPAPVTTAPAPTTTTAAKAEKEKKPKEETTTTSSTLPPPVDIPDSAIIPALPAPSGTSSADDGQPAQAPNSVPEGQAIALLQSKKSSGGALKLLIVSGIGLGALGIGTGAYKYANRSSKYFPA